MLTLSLDSTDQEILDSVYVWLDLLMSKRYHDAYEYTYSPEGHTWTPDLLKERIEFMASQHNNEFCIPEGHDHSKDFTEELHHVSRPDLNAVPLKSVNDNRLIGCQESFLAEAHRQDPNILGEVFFTMPFGNQWSDFGTNFYHVRTRQFHGFNPWRFRHLIRFITREI